MYLVDTNVLSELARPRPDARVVAWFDHEATIAISVISIEELSFGIARAPAQRRTKLASWLEQVVDRAAYVHDVSAAIARASGDLRGAPTRAGRPVAQADMLIAATAAIHGLSLATRNVADFVGCGVSVVNPFAP
jgi:predicted nucleic acid-binding protein